MTIEQDFYAFLDAGLSVSVYPILMPEKRTLPALTYQLIGSRPEYSADGAAAYPVEFRLNCWGSNYEAAKTLQSSVRALVDNYSGVMGSYHAHNVEIDNEFDDFEPDTGLYRVSMQINLFHRTL